MRRQKAACLVCKSGEASGEPAPRWRCAGPAASPSRGPGAHCPSGGSNSCGVSLADGEGLVDAGPGGIRAQVGHTPGPAGAEGRLLLSVVSVQGGQTGQGPLSLQVSAKALGLVFALRTQATREGMQLPLQIWPVSGWVCPVWLLWVRWPRGSRRGRGCTATHVVWPRRGWQAPRSHGSQQSVRSPVPAGAWGEGLSDTPAT